MSFDLTPCGHLRNNLKGEPQFCPKCRKAPALEKQAEIIAADLQVLISRWASLEYSPYLVSGSLLSLSVDLSRQCEVPRDKFIEHLTKAWPEPGEAHLPTHEPSK